MAEKEPTSQPENAEQAKAGDNDSLFNEETRKQMDSRMHSLRTDMASQMESSINQTMQNVSKGYQSHMHERVSSKQTDVLRTNKIFRDVARVLGASWKPVFESLMAGFPEDVIKNEMWTIEQQRPVIQAYEALTTWKGLKGADFDVHELVEVLLLHELAELSASVEATLSMGVDGLMTQNTKPIGVVSARPVTSEKAPDATSSTAEEQTTTGRDVQAGISGVLNNKNLLKLSKAIGGSWMEFARALQFPEDEIQELLKTDGMTYQSVFKVLWTWRDRVKDNVTQDNVAVLKEALVKSGKSGLAETLGP